MSLFSRLVHSLAQRGGARPPVLDFEELADTVGFTEYYVAQQRYKNSSTS